MSENTIDASLSPDLALNEALEFLRTKHDDNLDDFARHAKNLTAATTLVDDEISRLTNELKSKGLSSSVKTLTKLRIATHRDLKRKLLATHRLLSARLRDFSKKTMRTLDTTRLREAAKDPRRRDLWKPTLTKNLQRFPSEVSKKASGAKMPHTQAHWQPALADMQAILSEPSVELQRDAAEKFLRKHQPNWVAKLSGDAEYRSELLDVFLHAIESTFPATTVNP